jgi:cellulose synthase/poly-beta-1,6-N-acetylglucosamine synthase-like glycosyltransferase
MDSCQLVTELLFPVPTPRPSDVTNKKNNMELWLEALLWFSVIAVALITVGYPILLALASPLTRRRRHFDDATPSMSLIIAAHNEEACIARKLENALALDYRRDRLEIIVASDGSTDRTDEIVESFSDRGVQLRRYARIGKTGIQNQAAKVASGEILVFSDANGFYREDAIGKLVRNFADPTVACVVGQLEYEADGKSAGGCEHAYWRYEKFMKQRESDLSSLVGANGSIYAVRRADYVEIRNDLISDFVEPLALVRHGKRVVYEPEAISVESASTTYTVEFRRKVRILTRSIHGLLHMRALLNPFRYGIFSLQLFVHKFLRYMVPFFLTTGLGSLAALAATGRYLVPFLLTLVAIVVATLVGRGTVSIRASLPLRVCHLLYYYLLVNYAMVPAWINIFRGRRVTIWVPERKEA